MRIRGLYRRVHGENDRLESLASKFVALKLVDKTPEAPSLLRFSKVDFSDSYIISKGNLREVITKDVTAMRFKPIIKTL